MVQLFEEHFVCEQSKSQSTQNDNNVYLPCPTRLVELEEYANVAVEYMQAVSNNPNNWQVAMDRLRTYFNLEFKIYCDVCGSAHNQDEITAPER